MTFRPTLRPGAALLRRDANHVQIGTSSVIILRDRPGLMTALRLLDGVRDIPRLVAVAHETIPELTFDLAEEIHRLHEKGAVIDASLHGAVQRQRLHRRNNVSVGLTGDFSSAALMAEIDAALVACSIARSDHEPDISVVLSMGESARGVFEPFLRNHQPHLAVTIDEFRIRIGPLVIPGVSPCISCLDAHRGDYDPAWRALTSQFGRRSAIMTPAQPDALTLRSAGVVVAHELATLADRGRPRTLGGIAAVGPAPLQVEHESFEAHPRCTCSILVDATTADLS